MFFYFFFLLKTTATAAARIINAISPATAAPVTGLVSSFSDFSASPLSLSAAWSFSSTITLPHSSLMNGSSASSGGSVVVAEVSDGVVVVPD